MSFQVPMLCTFREPRPRPLNENTTLISGSSYTFIHSIVQHVYLEGLQIYVLTTCNLSNCYSKMTLGLVGLDFQCRKTSETLVRPN